MIDQEALRKSTAWYYRRSMLDMVVQRRGLISPSAAYNFIRYKLHRKTASMGQCIQVNLLLTRRCNLNCSFCCVDKLHGSGGRLKEFEVGIKGFKNLFEQPLINRALSYVLLGGEPLLNNDLEKIVEFLSGKGRLSRVISNALLLNPKRLMDLKRAGLSQLIVSLYDTNENHVSELLPALPSAVPIYLTKVILRSDLEQRYDYLLDSLKCCTASSCRGLMLSTYMPQGQDDLDDVVFDDNKILSRFYSDVYKRYPGVPISFPTPVVRNPGDIVKRCSVPWNTVYLDAKGNLGLCCRFQAHPDAKYGNIFEGGVAEKAANGPISRKLRAELLSRKPDTPQECLNCSTLYDDCSLRMLFEKARLKE